MPELKLIISVDDQGSAKIVNVTGNLDKLKNAAGGAGQGAASATSQYGNLAAQAGNAAASLGQVLGVTLSIAGAAYLAQKAFSTWYDLVSSGIKTIDELKQTIYSTAGTLALMSEGPKPAAYEQWKEYLDWLRRETNIADREAAASGREIFETATALAVRGTVANTREQVKIIANLTDEIKAQIKGMAGGSEMVIRQINQEIRALFEGRIQGGSQLALALERLDPNLKENFQTAVETGRVLEYINSILPRIEARTKDIGNTWESVYSSLVNAKDEIMRAAFGDAYKDVVQFGKEVIDSLYRQGELTEKGQAAAKALGTAWSTAKPKISEALDYLLNHSDEAIKNVESIASAVGSIAGTAAWATKAIAGLITELGRLAQEPIVQMMLGAAAGFRVLGPWGAVAGASYPGAKHLASKPEGTGDLMGGPLTTFGQKEMEPGGPWMPLRTLGDDFSGYELPLLEELYGKPAPKRPGLRPPGVKGGAGDGGGKGAEAEARRLMSLFDTLQKDIARLSEGSFAEIDANLEKTLDQIYSRQQQRVVSEADLEVMARQRAALQKEKLESDFWQYVAKESGNTFAALDAQYWEDVKKWGNTEEKKAALLDIWAKKTAEAGQKAQRDLEDLQKSSLQAISQSTPYLSEQLAIEGQILEMELRRNRAELELKLSKQMILDADKGYYRFLNEQEKELLRLQQQRAEAYQTQAQERKSWMAQGTGGGVAAWAYDRREQAQTRDAQAAIDMLQESERMAGDALGQGVLNFFKGHRTDFSALGDTIGDAFIKRGANYLVAKGFDAIAGMMGFSIGGKPDGSRFNPYFVTLANGGLAGLTGSTGGPQDFIGLAAEEMQELLGAEDLAEWAAGLERVQAEGTAFFAEMEGGFSGMFSFIGSGLSSLLSSLTGGGGGGGGGLFGWLGGLFGGGESYVGGEPGNFLLDGEGGLLSWLGSFFGAAEGGLLPGPWRPLARFGDGGVVSRPTLGWVGERGEPELVVPLRGGRVPVERVKGPQAGTPTPPVINFYIQTPDARSFLSGPNQSQISAKLGLAMRRAAARDW